MTSPLFPPFGLEVEDDISIRFSAHADAYHSSPPPVVWRGVVALPSKRLGRDRKKHVWIRESLQRLRCESRCVVVSQRFEGETAWRGCVRAWQGNLSQSCDRFLLLACRNAFAFVCLCACSWSKRREPIRESGNKRLDGGMPKKAPASGWWDLNTSLFGHPSSFLSRRNCVLFLFPAGSAPSVCGSSQTDWILQTTALTEYYSAVITDPLFPAKHYWKSRALCPDTDLPDLLRSSDKVQRQNVLSIVRLSCRDRPASLNGSAVIHRSHRPSPS